MASASGAGEVWLIANPRAGGGRGSRHASVATKALHDAQIPCRLLHPSSAADTTRAAQEAVAAGAAAVVACGGDGTVHAVLQGVFGSEVPLGIVAGGSGDDVAADLGFVTSTPEAIAAHLVAAIRSGVERRVDVAVATTADGTRRCFLGVMSTGFDSSVNERANAMSRLGGQRYNVAIVRELASFRPAQYEVEIDDARLSGPGMLVSVGNGSRYGGGMRVCPGARTDDGLLDITWLGAVSKATFLRVFPSVFSGRHVTHPAVTTHQGRTLRIAAAGQVAWADGERIGPLPVEVEVRPAALRVLSG
jgi:diacylglycerol kinase (ATP)